MIYKEKELKKETIDQNNNRNKIDTEKESDNLIKKNLIKFLQAELKESEEKIIEKEKMTEKEIMSVYNRLNKDIERSMKFSLEKLILEFLPVIDNIERALDLIKKSELQEDYKEILNKLKLTYDLLKKFLTTFHVKKIDDINILFNPAIHQAMSVDYTNTMESNQIVTVMQPGYIFHNSRLLRPAMVVVSKRKI